MTVMGLSYRGLSIRTSLVDLVHVWRDCLLQFVPYTLLRSHFVLKPEDAQTLDGLLGTEVLLLAIFGLLIWLKK